MVKLHPPLVDQPDDPIRTGVDGGDVAATRTTPRRGRARVVFFVALCAVALAAASGYLLVAARRIDSQTARTPRGPVAAPEALAELAAQPHLVFLQTDGDGFRQLGLAPLDPSTGPPQLTSLRCQRVYFAAGRGLCLGKDQFGGAFTFDKDFEVQQSLPISGIPSRVRISPDGRYGTMTVFVQGHSYADGAFSTRTALVDMATGTILADLEDFIVLRDNSRWQSADFNFWGVTFARDSSRFYGTLASGGKTYLVEGDVADRQVRILRENVECPSLSPDNSRLVFKKRMPSDGQRVVWQFHLLDLATMQERPLSETRNVDDQAEWLDDEHILYVLPDQGPPATIRTDLWVVAVDGATGPRRLATSALSPTVVR